MAHVVLFSTDLSLSYEKIIDYYSLRFQIEFVFRDAKQYWGMEDLELYVDSIPHCSNSVSVNSLFKEINRALHEENPAFYKIPDSCTFHKIRRIVF